MVEYSCWWSRVVLVSRVVMVEYSWVSGVEFS